LNRPGSSQNAVVIALGSLLLLGVLVFAVSRMGKPAARPLLVYCAASNKPVLERVAKDYQQETRVEVQLQFGPSQTLLANIEISKTGDLYLPADDQYLKQAEEKKLTSEVFQLVTMHGVVVVAKGNPRGIQSFEDLLQDGLRVSLANPEAAAIGKVSKDKLSAQSKWKSLAARAQTFKTTVNDVANDLKVGAADAGIVWDAVAVQYPDLETIELPELKDVGGHVAIAVLTTSQQPDAAKAFAQYLAAEDKGLAVYRELGFKTVAGKPWQPPKK
jgi:molybdate transport system substrate-binding protein